MTISKKITEQFLQKGIYSILDEVVLSLPKVFTCEHLKHHCTETNKKWKHPKTIKNNVFICLLPICPWAPFLAATCFCLIDSLIRSTSFWYRARSLCAPSLASFSACSNAFTRSCVARRRFSSLGSSHLRSALSLTSCETEKQLNGLKSKQKARHLS